MTSALPSFTALLIDPLLSPAINQPKFGESYVTEADLILLEAYLVQGISLLVRARPNHPLDLVQLVWENSSLGREQTFLDVAHETTPAAILMYREAFNDNPVSIMDLISFMHIGQVAKRSEYQLEYSRLSNVRKPISGLSESMFAYKALGIGIGLYFPHLASPSINIDRDTDMKIIPDNQTGKQIERARRIAEINTLGHASLCAILSNPQIAIKLNLGGFIQHWDPNSYERVKRLIDNKTDDGRAVFSW